jgi:hypothetical protein
MKQTVIDNVKDLFGSSFRKKVKKADSLAELRKKLVHKKEKLTKKIDESDSGSERKLLHKKVKVLTKQISKIDNKLG